MSHVAWLIYNMDGGGGAERVALSLIRDFVKRGHSIDLLLVSNSGELLPLLPAQVRIVDLKGPRVRDAFWPLVRYLRETQPVALQASMWPLTVAAIAAARLSGVGTRVVTSDHSALTEHYETQPWTLYALRWTIRLFYPFASARVCVSTGVARDLARLSALPESTFSVIYNPVPAPPEEVPRGDPPPGWLEGDKRILNVGTLKNEKNQALLIEAFARLPAALDARLLILGEGQERPALERLVRELGLGPRVFMPGFSTNPWPSYFAADLFVLSSDYEGFGNVIVEAMHAGLPIVSTDCLGPAEILDGGRYGVLVPTGDKQLMADAMAKGLAEPANPGRQKRRAADFSVAAAVDRYERALLGL